MGCSQLHPRIHTGALPVPLSISQSLCLSPSLPPPSPPPLSCPPSLLNVVVVVALVGVGR